MEYFRNKNFNAEVITLLELTTFWKKVQFLSIDHGSNHRTNIYGELEIISFKFYLFKSIWHLPNISTL